MRQYRGKTIDTNEWVYGDVHWGKKFESAHIHPILGCQFSRKVIPETVGQSTGLKYADNKTEAYKGDLCQRDEGSIFEIRWDDFRAKFYLYNKTNPLRYIEFVTTTILYGTIHDKDAK